MPGLEPDLVAAATRFSAATIHEACGQQGALPSMIKPVSPAFRLGGPAFTVRCAPGDNLWLHRGMYQAAPGDVLVVETGGHLEAGYWGEIMTRAALGRKLSGLVLEGGVRDAAVIAGLGLPVFASRVCLRGTSKTAAAGGGLGLPIRIGEVVVRPGDLVVGDLDGVVIVPAENAAAVIVEAQARVEREAAILRALEGGARTLDLLGLAPS